MEHQDDDERLDALENRNAVCEEKVERNLEDAVGPLEGNMADVRANDRFDEEDADLAERIEDAVKAVQRHIDQDDRVPESTFETLAQLIEQREQNLGIHEDGDDPDD